VGIGLTSASVAEAALPSGCTLSLTLPWTKG
jgi:hypothetical protein